MRRLALLGLALAVFALPWAALAQSVDVDLVVLVDTSASVRDDVDRLCTELPKVIQSIGGDGLAVRWRVFSIKDTYNCAKDTVQATIPGSAVADDEDWGIAIAELAAGYAWQPSASRLIIPLSDSGPASGNPVSDPGPDRDVTTLAIRAAIANKVILSPLLSGPAPDTSADDRARLEALAQDMASKTGGRVFLSPAPDNLVRGIQQLIVASVEAKAGLTAIAAAIPTPGKVSLDTGILLTNAILAALCAALLGLTATLARESFGTRPSLPPNRVTDAVRSARSRIGTALNLATTPTAWRIGNLRIRRALTIVVLTAFLALTALIASFLDPNFQPNTPAGIATFVTLLAALTLADLAAAFGGNVAARSMRLASGLQVRPGAVLWIAAGVAISRSIGFLPGYVLGLPAGLALIAAESNRDQDAAVGRASMIAAIAAGAIAWLIAWPLESLSASLSGSAGSGAASLALTITGGIQSALLTIFLVAVQFALIELLPLGSTAGHAWFSRSRIVWGGVFGVAMFAALHTLFNPNRAGLDALRNPGLLPLGAFVAAYSGITLVAWLLTNEARIRQPGNLNRRSALIAGVLIVTWLAGIACVALAEAASTFNPTTIVIVVPLLIAGTRVRW